MEKKQTALYWLLDRIIENNNLSEIHLSLFDILKAKEMEKEQIIDAYLKDKQKSNIGKVLLYIDKAEEYYNETYKTE